MTVPAVFDTPHPITAKVEMARGTLQVVASDRADTVVAVLPRDEAKALDVRTAERTRVSYSKGVLSVLSSQGLTFRTGTIDILIELPSHSILDIAVASAAVRADGDYADVRFQSSSGELVIDAINGAADADTASGGVSIRELNGDIKRNSASGDLAVKVLRGHARVASASGSVDIGAAVAGGLVFETASGNTSIGIARGTAARLAIDTHSGAFTNSLEPAEGPDAADEIFDVNIRTAKGDVDLHRPVTLAG
ncbi:Uncharacterised protein [Mycobacteroides abscessus]|nr:Uncharacterised protein [Mycobacteroides abscessus]